VGSRDQKHIDRILLFTHFECPPFKLTKKQKKTNYLEQLQNTIPLPITFTTTPLTQNLTVPYLERYSLGSANEQLHTTISERLVA